MFAVYAKDEDEGIGCSHRYQETVFLGVYSTIELAKEQIERHKIDIQERRNSGDYHTPRYWEYYVYSCELDVCTTKNEEEVLYKTQN